MESIFKYPLELTDLQTIDLPGRHKVLSVQKQGESLCLWAWVETNSPRLPVTIAIVGTGNSFPSTLAPGWHIASVIDGPFVWHVFEVKP